MKTMMYDDEDWGTQLVNTELILKHFNIDQNELWDLVKHGYVYPIVTVNSTLWSIKKFYDAYDYMDRLEREYKVVQSFRSQSK